MAWLAQIEGLASPQAVDAENVTAFDEAAQVGFQQVQHLAALPGQTPRETRFDAAETQAEGGVHRIVGEPVRVGDGLAGSHFCLESHRSQMSFLTNKWIGTLARSPRGSMIWDFPNSRATSAAASGMAMTSGSPARSRGGSGQ